MKIETKLSFNNIRKNIKRTIFTTISIVLCTFLISTTMILISSIRNGITENIDTSYNDYHFVIENINIDSFNSIKNKKYIDKIYIQENNNEQMYELGKTDTPVDTQNNITVYLKYNNIKQTYKYSTDIIQTLDLSLKEAQSKCRLNEKLLTVYGLIEANIQYSDDTGMLMYKSTINFSYILDLLIIVILAVFSCLSIIILYNAFLITINERKKEYAVLNSIGGTEGQVLKMIFLETTIMGIFGIIIGYLLSYLGANIILEKLNNILALAEYNFKLIIDIKYLIISFFIIIFNIYISTIIPALKASNTSAIQSIRNNKQIKYKKRKTILEKILPVEGKIAIKNARRNKNKYRVINILLVICMTSYISVSTYIAYEKEASDLIDSHDVDAELIFEPSPTTDYKSILDDYIAKSGDQIECMEYKALGPFVLVEPENALTPIPDSFITYADNKKSTEILIIGLDDTTYSKYINKLHANYGDYILYNIIRTNTGEEETVYQYSPRFEENIGFKLSTIFSYTDSYTGLSSYEIINNDFVTGNIILTDELIDGYKEIKNSDHSTLFVDMNTYNKIAEKFNNYIPNNKNSVSKWLANSTDCIYVKIKCKNITEFSNYIESIIKKQDIEIIANYYSLDKTQKNIFINVLQLILETIILVIMLIGIVSSINIISASLYERKDEFKTLNSLGATQGNINKILIYECIYMFIKSIIISIIISAPIVYKIIKYMENIIILNKILIPFTNIALFFILLFIISLFITLYSAKSIKDK